MSKQSQPYRRASYQSSQRTCLEVWSDEAILRRFIVTAADSDRAMADDRLPRAGDRLARGSRLVAVAINAVGIGDGVYQVDVLYSLPDKK